MRTLSKEGGAERLKEREIEENPYRRKGSVACFYSQFSTPQSRARKDGSVCRWLVGACEPFGEALLQPIDWPLYEQDEMAVFTNIRAAHGEKDWLINKPGHLFDSGERDLLIGMASLCLFYGWTAYIYFDHQTTILLWEGDLIDIWGIDRLRYDSVHDALSSGLKLKSTLSPTEKAV